MRLAAFLLGLLLAWPAWADMYPDASNAAPGARANLGGWPTVDAVKDLGCVGDGVTNNTACITAMAAKTGSPNIYFGPGTYMFNCGTYTMAGTPTISGAGRTATTLRLQPGCTMPAAIFVSANKSGGGWRDLTIDANNAVAGSVLPSKVVLSYSCHSDGVIDGVGITKMSSNTLGVLLATGGCIARNWHVSNNYFHLTTATGATQNLGFAMGGVIAPADFQDIYIHNNTIVNTALQVNGTNVHVTNNDISGFGFGTGIYQVERTSFKHTITGNHLHDSTTVFDFNGTPAGGIELDGNDSIFANNICWNLGGSCVSVFGTGNIISGNISKNVSLATPQIIQNWGAYRVVSNPGQAVIATNNIIQNNVDLGGAAQLYSYWEHFPDGVNNIVRNNKFAGGSVATYYVLSTTTRVTPGPYEKIISPVTTTQAANISSTVYLPGGASVGAINEIIAAPTLGATAVPVGVLRGLVTNPYIDAGFTGTLGHIMGADTATSNLSSVTVPLYSGYHVESMTNGHGITTGSAINVAFNMAASTAAAGAGGTVENNAFRAVIGQGSSAGTTNRGIYITGNAVALSISRSLYSDSTAPMEISSPFITMGYTVGTLPATATLGRIKGARVHVTDQTGACPAVGAALTGGGAVTCPVFYNGTAWVGG